MGAFDLDLQMCEGECDEEQVRAHRQRHEAALVSTSPRILRRATQCGNARISRAIFRLSETTARVMAATIGSWPGPLTVSITVDRLNACSSPWGSRIRQRVSRVTSPPGWPSNRTTVTTTRYWMDT